jgi:hypothetical protein
VSAHTQVYLQCGLRIRTDLDVALAPASGTAWDVDVHRGPDIRDTDGRPPGEVIAAYEFADTAWYTATATDDGFTLRVHNRGEFRISADLSHIEARADPADDQGLLPILLAGTVSAFLLALRHETVLHASAVLVEGRALVFVGQSGRGKSTLAALMCTAGDALITDDVLTVSALPEPTCAGGSTEVRLRTKAAGIVSADRDATTHLTADNRLAFAPKLAPLNPIPLGAIVVPTPSRTHSSVRVERLQPSEGLLALLSFPRIHGWRRRDVLSRDFSTLSHLVNSTPIFAATIPWGPPFDPIIVGRLSELVEGANVG